MALRPFTEYAAGIATAGLPDEALHAAKRCVIDWFASVLPGGLQPLATLLILAYADSIGSRGGSGGAVLYPSGQRTDPRTAALINGAAVHTIEFDEIYRDALYHLGAPVISAALALAQARGRDGNGFMRGVIAGYEISSRMGVVVNPAHYKFWNTTGTIGTFGAAAASSAGFGR